MSLAFHASLLFSFRQAGEPSDPPGGLAGPAVMARIVSRPVEALKANNHATAGEVPLREEVLRKASEGILRPRAASENPDQADLRDSSWSTASSGATRADSAASAPVRSSAVAGEAVARLEDTNPDGIRQYRLSLAREARRFKRYPDVARERGWEGDVVIVVNTVAGAELPQVALGRSSGLALLDNEAVSLVGQAVRSAAIPDSLRGRSFALTLPIQFRIDE